MSLRTHGCGALFLLTLLSPPRVASQQLTEKEALRRFAEENQRARALGARVEIARAESRVRTLLPTPGISYSREDAVTKEGYLLVEQRIPMNGRLGFLRRAGDAAINVQKEQSHYALYQLRSDLRLIDDPASKILVVPKILTESFRWRHADVLERRAYVGELHRRGVRPII